MPPTVDELKGYGPTEAGNTQRDTFVTSRGMSLRCLRAAAKSEE